MDKQAAEVKRIDSKFERSSMDNILNSMASYREIIHEKSIDAANFIVDLFEETATSNYPHQSAAINIEARLSTSKKIMTFWSLRWWLTVFSNTGFFN